MEKRRRKSPKKPLPVTLDSLLKDYVKGQDGKAAFVVTADTDLEHHLKKVAKLSGASFNTTVNVLLAGAVAALDRTRQRLY